MTTEKAKMLAGELYDSTDATLASERLTARRLTAELNAVPPGDMNAYDAVRARLFPNAHKTFWVEPPFHCDYGYNLYVGANTFFNFDCVVLDVCPVTIGHGVMFGPNVQIYAASHPMSARARRDGLEYGKPIWIGNDCWIGGSAVICPGVRIGHRCVVGTGSIVTRDLPDDVFAAGNPARVVRTLSSEPDPEAD